MDDLTKFEESLQNMSKPGIGQLEHPALLDVVIRRTRGSNVLSWWWLSIPLYVTGAFLMKAFFMPGSTLADSISELYREQTVLFTALFGIAPAITAILNVAAFARISRNSAVRATGNTIRHIWPNLLLLSISLAVLIIFFTQIFNL